MVGTRHPVSVVPLLTLSAVAALVLAGCTPSVDPTSDPAIDPFAAPIVPGVSSAVVPGDPAQSGVRAIKPRRGTGTVTVIVAQGRVFSDQLAHDFQRATGFQLDQVEVADQGLSAGHAATGPSDAGESGPDLVMGLDATDALDATWEGVLADSAPQDAVTAQGTALTGAPGAVAYARDDVCVLADTQWFAANALALPSSLDDLASSTYAPLLEIPDPASTTAGRAFVQVTAYSLGDRAAPWWKALLDAGAQVDAAANALPRWTGWTDRSAAARQVRALAPVSAGSGTRPLLVGPASWTAMTLSNTGIESTSAPLGMTCLARTLYAARTVQPRNAAGAESFLAYLLTPRAQQALGEESLATPLAASAAENTPIGWFAAPSDEAVLVAEEALGRTPDWLSSWSSARASR